MALMKEIIFKNGVSIKYHYIKSFEMNGKDKEVNLIIDSYTDASYRDLEKKDRYNKLHYEELFELIQEENQKESPDKELVIKLTDEANSLVGTFEENNEFNLSVISHKITLKNVTDFNMSNLYALLKQEEMFKDSLDI